MKRYIGPRMQRWLRAVQANWLPVALCLAGLALLYATLVGVPVRAAIDPTAITKAQFGSGENAFAANPRHPPELLRSDRMGALEASSLRLFEDARPLGPAHSLHVDVAAQGSGLYSHWNGTIYFSSTDNSDPRTNGRSYHYAGYVHLPIGFFIAGVLCLAASLWLGWRTVAAAFGRVTRHSRPKLSSPTAQSASILLIAISLLWLFQLLITARQDVSHDDVLVVIGYCFLAIAMQSLVLFLVPMYTAFLFVLFGVVNTYSLYFVFSGDLTTYPSYMQLLLLLAMAALYFVLFQILLSLSALRGWIGAGAGICVTVVGIAAVMPLFGGTSAARASDPQFPGMRVVTFKRHPNVYFLGFDALMPGRLTEKLLRIARPPYIDAITKHGGHIFRNMFADEVRTMQFWVRTMSILPVSRLDSKIILGIEPSPVLATFQRNGYDTHFSFWNAYMGPNKGPFLTSYAVSEPYSTCSFLDSRPKRYGFFGYCTLREANWLSRPWITTGHVEAWNEFYLERLRSVTRGAKSTPYFFASHYPRPGHTSSSYRNTESEFRRWREAYLTHSRAATRIMDEMLTEIRTEDPTAIVFVFGDHGSMISQGLNYADDPEFVVQDSHGILGAVFGAEACMHFLQPPAGKKFQTSSRVVAGLLQCLAGGESPLLVKYDFGRINQAPNNMRFEDYVYE